MNHLYRRNVIFGQGKNESLKDIAQKVMESPAKDGLDLHFLLAALKANRPLKRKVAHTYLAKAFLDEKGKFREVVKEEVHSLFHTPTELFFFAEAMLHWNGGKWNRAMRSVLAKWIRGKGDKLSWLAAKYQNREGWQWHDILNVVHPKPAGIEQEKLFRYLTSRKAGEGGKKKESGGEQKLEQLLEAIRSEVEAPEIFAKIEKIKRFTDAQEDQLIQFLRDNPDITWEMVPSEKTKSVAVSRALATKMNFTPLLRNLRSYKEKGVMNEEIQARFLNLLSSETKTHPFALILAAKMQEDSSSEIVKALMERAGQLISQLPISKQKIVVGLDISGSMLEKLPQLGDAVSSHEVSVWLTQMVMRQYPESKVFFFERQIEKYPYKDAQAFAKDALAASRRMGTTNLGGVIEHHVESKEKIDAFFLITDSEGNCGWPIDKAIQRYKVINPDFKVIILQCRRDAVCVDEDGLMENVLEIAGVDPSLPEIMQEWINPNEPVSDPAWSF